jgi:general secretion pathway protein K
MKPQRGTALLLAMVILTLVATLASAMVAQQQRAIAVEAAERGRAQAAWVLVGALDWARLLLREDARSGKVDDLGEPWATPLAEARLSTFLAADRNSPSADEGPDAFLSGQVLDLQARFNLNNLLNDEGKLVEAEVLVLTRLCQILGLPEDVASRIAIGLEAAVREGDDSAPLLPLKLEQLTWLGIDTETIARLQPYAVMLPKVTPVNANTAPREVLAAAVEGLDLGSAERLVQRRQRAPFKSLDEIKQELPPAVLERLPASRLGVGSDYFEVLGRLRLEGRVFEERSVVHRRGANQGGEIVAIQRERRSIAPGTLP